MKRILNSANGPVLAAALLFLVIGTAISLLHAFANIA